MHRTFALLATVLFVTTAAVAEKTKTPKPKGKVAGGITFSPSGTVKEVSQAQARFTEPMVALGDPRAPSPFQVDCSKPGSGRWVDPKIWVYDFKGNLPGGNRCTFTVNPGLKSLAGTPITVAEPFRFDTGGPNVERTEPWQHSTSVDEAQVFLVVLDGPVDRASVAPKVWFTVAGVEERVPVEVLSESETAELAKRELYTTAERVVALRAKRRFPNGAAVTLVWGKGVRSAAGVETHSDQVFQYTTRGPFRAEMSCSRENADAPCSPLGDVRVVFSAYVALGDAKKVLLEDQTGKKYAAKVDETSAMVDGVMFAGPFPQKAQMKLTVPTGVKDDAGRSLENAASFPLSFPMGTYPALAKFAASFGILEAKDPVLPLTVRNVEADIRAERLKVEAGPGSPVDPAAYTKNLDGRKYKLDSGQRNEFLKYLRRLETTEGGRSVFQPSDSEALESGVAIGPQPLPKGVTGITVPKRANAEAMEVVGIPLGKPGFYLVELTSPVLGRQYVADGSPMAVTAGALVTNLAVHFKSSDAGSAIAWVTELASGTPAAGAQVEVRDCGNRVLWSGKADKDGLARIADLPESPADCGRGHVYSRYNSGYLVLATKGDDTTFVHTGWDDGIEPWRFHVTTGGGTASRQPAHTVFDRPLYRAGDTVHMKHFLREIERGALAYPKTTPKRLLLRHSGTDEKVRLPLAFDATGVATTDWTIPKGAKLGIWSVAFTENDEDDYGREVGTIRVEEFRVPLLKATLDGPKTAVIAANSITVDASLQYLSGGPASQADVKLRSVPQSASLAFPDYEGFVFANGNVSLDPDGDAKRPAPEIRTTPAKLDGNGTARFNVTGFGKKPEYFAVQAELEFADPNGETQTIARAFPVYPSSALVGGRVDGWVQRQDDVRLAGAVVTPEGKPIAGVEVTVQAFRRKNFGHRKRLVGGFYAYENTTRVEKLGEFCRGKTDQRGRIACSGKASEPGELLLEFKAADTEGRTSVAWTDVYVTGSDSWFTAGDGDRIDVLPVDKRVEPGSTARAQVRMPFREATALVTLEREGVIDAYVRKLSGKDPIVEVPVGMRHAPNIFVSVLAIRGRVGGTAPTALVDLGKPAFKMGVAEFAVGWKSHALQVQVKPERPVYKVREKASVSVTVATADGSPLPEGAEIAVAAIDEGLLELAPATSWDVLTSMMQPRGLGVRTATAMSRVVGKRHFGLKAMPSGGGGGSERTRELFDTLLFWNARVKVGADGKASVTIPLNDSLTGFRIAAVASAGSDRFGTGQTSIRTTQPLMILSGIPPVARQGDTLEVAVTARNATEAPMMASVALKAQSVVVGGAPQTVALAPGESKRVTWNYAIPKDAESVRYEVTAHGVAQAGKANDKLAVTQRVLSAVPVRVYQSTISQLEGPFAMPVERPVDAEPGRGEVAVALQSSLKENSGGVRRYMSQYPYGCLEQRVSKAVALRDKKAWAGIVRDMPAYFAAGDLLRFFPDSQYGSAILSAYVLAISQEAGWALPKPLQERVSGALSAYVEGSSAVRESDAIPSGPDLGIRRMFALEALSRYPGRKAFVQRMLPTIAVDVPLWPTGALLDYWNVLRRTRSSGLADPDAVRVFETIRGRLNLGGTSLALSTERSDAMPWLLVSGDLVAVRLLNDFVDAPAMAEDAGRLVRGTLARQKQGHWDLTLANAWGTLALEKFAKKFENEKITGTTKVALTQDGVPLPWSGGGKSTTRVERSFPWPEGKQELKVLHEGSGKPWLFVTALAAIPLKAPLEAGFQVTRNVEPVLQKTKGKWSVGDIAKVRLEVASDVDRSWVVVNDPIPSGAAVLGGGLGRDTKLAAETPPETAPAVPASDEVWPYLAFEERSFEGFRAYYEWVPRGKFRVEYKVRLNAAGSFGLPTTRVEAMYQPEAFSERPNARWEIVP